MNLGTPTATNNYGLPSALGQSVGQSAKLAAPADWWGQAPWFSVPTNSPFESDGWPVSVDSSGNVFATDSLGNRYACRTNEAFYLVFQRLPTVC